MCAPHLGLQTERESLFDTLAAGLRQIPTTKKLVLAGDFNADIGANAAIPDEGRFDVTTDRVRGPFGLGRRTQAGLGLEAWARELGLCFWATFQRQRRRGTWQHRRTHAWHGLEWFVGRVGERGALVQSVRTISEELWTDHLPKVARIKLEGEPPRWRPCNTTRLAVERMQGKTEEVVAL